MTARGVAPVAHALGLGFWNVAVLDLSAEALTKAKTSLGDDATRVEWIVADGTSWKPSRHYDIWHDRGTFHFLTKELECIGHVSRRGQPVGNVIARPLVVLDQQYPHRPSPHAEELPRS